MKRRGERLPPCLTLHILDWTLTTQVALHFDGDDVVVEKQEQKPQAFLRSNPGSPSSAALACATERAPSRVREASERGCPGLRRCHSRVGAAEVAGDGGAT